jgi:hypothetical protein
MDVYGNYVKSNDIGAKGIMPLKAKISTLGKK